MSVPLLDSANGLVGEIRDDLLRDEFGVAVITMIADDIPSRPDSTVLPEIGSEIEGVLLRYGAPGRQSRLSLRPNDLKKARRAT